MSSFNNCFAIFLSISATFASVHGESCPATQFEPQRKSEETCGDYLVPPDDGLFDAAWEALYTALAFGATALTIQGLKRRNQRNASKMSAATGVQRRKDGVHASPCGNGTNVKPSLPRGGNRRGGADLLVASGRQVRAKELLGSTDATIVRNAAPGADKVEERLISELRLHVSRRQFHGALAVYDSVKKPRCSGVEGFNERGESRASMRSSCAWSLLLYSAVEAKQFYRCPEFIERLLETRQVSCNDFVNMVRFNVHQRDVGAFTNMLNELQAWGMHVDIITRNRSLAVCTSNRAMELADVLASHKICAESMDTVGYNTLMKGYSHAGKPARCFEVYESMREAHLAPSEMSFGILLDACINAEDLNRARQIFADLRTSGLPMNVIHYTNFIKNLVAAGELQEATDVFEEMSSMPSTMPDMVTYSTLAKAHSDQGNVIGAVRVLEHMFRRGIVPDAILFNMVLTSSCVKSMDPAQVKHLFKWLVHHGLEATTTTMSIMVKAFVQSQAWDEALGFLESAARNVPQGTITTAASGSPDWRLVPEGRLYAQLAQACAKAGQYDKALETYAAMAKVAKSLHNPIGPALNLKLLKICCGEGICKEDSVAHQIFQAIARAAGSPEAAEIDALMP